MTYSAIIAKVDEVHKIEGADRIVRAVILGTDVVVGADVKKGDVGIFFPVDGQLSEEYAFNNNLMKAQGGYLEENRRVKNVRLKGVKSEGLFMPLESLDYFLKGGYAASIGTLLTHVNETEICRKYVSPQTLRQMNAAANKGKVKRGETEMFKKHFDTDQLRFSWPLIKKGDRLIITEKLHGTSQRYGYVLDKKPQGRLAKLLKLKPEYEWVEMAGTRNVIITDTNKETGYHSADFRDKACLPFVGKLHKGEVVYYEVVGYEGPATAIMGSVSTKDVKFPESVRYKANAGALTRHIEYSYGNAKGQFEVYVYRITLANPDGHTVDYSWEDVKKRCAELGVKHVPELAIIPSFGGQHRTLEKQLEKNFPDTCSTLDNTHPMEGIAIRIEGGLKPRIFKKKFWTFGYLEGIFKDTNVDTEEVS